MWRTKSSRYFVHTDVCQRVSRRSSPSSKSFSTQKNKVSNETIGELKSLFEQHATQNNLSSTDWYHLSSNSLDEKTQKIVSKKFGGSLYRALSTLYPEIEWKAWKFQHHPVPPNFWKEQSNQRKFFDDLGHILGIQTLDDWYEKLSPKEIAAQGASGMLAQHKNSAASAVMAAYPEHNWIPWKFTRVFRGYWNDISNQKKFFDDLGEQLGVKKLDDWYSKLSRKQIEKHDGAGILALYNDSPTAALMACYPEHNWIPWKFGRVTLRYWEEEANRRKFFDEVGKQIGIQNMDDWYSKLSHQVIEKYRGRGLLYKYNDSPAAALMSAYPEHNWAPWKFSVLPRYFWNSQDNVRQFMNELSEKLSIQTLDDWYLVDTELLKQFGATSLLTRYKGLYNILKEQYPHHPWNRNKFKQVGKKTQRWLAVTLKKIFPDEEILEDYIHPKAVFPTSKRPIQLDIYLPSRSLAFEYQGEQHYQETSVFASMKVYQQRDKEKRIVCAENNIKLIEVPYWWNRTQESLQEIIDKSNQTLSIE